MSLKEKAKEIFAEEIEHEAASKSISDITVSDICKACEATRQSFYYHFHDKYDLIAWIYMQDFAFSIEKAGDFGKDTLVGMFQRIYQRKSFYQNAFSDHSQNNLLDYINQYDTKFLLDMLGKEYNIDTSSIELETAVRYHSYGLIGVIKDWLNGNIKETDDQLAEFLHDTFSDLINKYVKPNS